MQNFSKRLDRFFLTPTSPLPLAALRISLAILLLVQAYFLRDSVIALFSRDGLIQGPLVDTLRSPTAPYVGMLADRLAPFGISESACLYTTCGAYVISLVLLALGLFTRVASIFVWFLHWVLMTTGCTSAYGVDIYAHVFLFYLIWVPAGDALSLDSAFARMPWRGRPSWQAGLGIRALQLHLCISYLGSAIDKFEGVQWRTGEVIWRSLTLPLFRQYDLSWLAHYPALLLALSWGTLILEGGYFIFIWPRRTRYLWMAGILSLHLGIAVFLGLHLFGLVMCALTACLFGKVPGTFFATRRAAALVPNRLPTD